MEVETIKTRATCGCMATGQSPWPRAWLRLRLYAGSVFDDSVAEAAYAAIVVRYKWTLPLPFNCVCLSRDVYSERWLVGVVIVVGMQFALWPWLPASNAHLSVWSCSRSSRRSCSSMSWRHVAEERLHWQLPRSYTRIRCEIFQFFNHGKIIMYSYTKQKPNTNLTIDYLKCSTIMYC